MGEYKFIVRVTCKTYNHAAFIKDAMDGFCMQETSFPFLCIIVDDASMDGEQEVIQKYLNEHFALTGDDDFRRDETDDYIRIYARHKTNTNCYFLVIFLKYNHYSIKKSKAPYIKEWKDTKYIAMCEGDDYWIDSRKLQRQYDFMESHPDFSLCCHNAIVSFENKDKRAFNSVGEDREIKMEELLDKWLCPTASLFIRRSVLPTFPVNGNIIGGDWRIILHCAASGKVWSINDVMACYRRTNIRTSCSKLIKN